MRSVGDHIPPTQVPQQTEKKVDREVVIYTQDDIDDIDRQYREKEERFKRKADPANVALDQYRKSLINDTSFQKEIIVYDQNTGRWKLVKDEK